ncbi:MAG: bifunctional phosphopantothenoylcysteine decarboxylase/phosphopantothenate--cysteine ligase CoaBC [Flavicella sp.]
MSVLQGKNILLGVTAGIAAYKTAHLVRLCIKAGANVQVVMTPASKDFVTPLTLSTLSKNPVHSTFYEKNDENELWTNHVELGLWADLMLIAPATANTLSKMTSGTADNLLLAVYLSAKCPVYFAPAMDLDMFKHPSTLESIEKLQSFGNILIPAASGELASGLVGEGRMAEPETIVSHIEANIKQSLPLYGKTVLITAGPTYEAIDPVRFIGNHSSGKMGFQLAVEAANLGASVILITGPSSQTIAHSSVKRIDVVSAIDMYHAVHEFYEKASIVIAAAAVADYTPVVTSDQKLKKQNEELILTLTKTKDILASMGSLKQKQFLVGFALETENELAYAKGKLRKKNLDMVILNSLKDKGAGFSVDSNKITILDKDNTVQEFSLKSKALVAKDIFVAILKKYHV